MTKNFEHDQQTFELDRKYNKYYHNDEHYHVNMNKIDVKVCCLNDFNSYGLMIFNELHLALITHWTFE